MDTRLLLLPLTSFSISTYPQGDGPILPQILSLMAVFATMQAFGVLAWRADDAEFMCIELDDNQRSRVLLAGAER